MNNVQAKQRNSSVELFRIVATFLVLIVHFNGWFIGGMPNKLTNFNIPMISQALIESLSATCVNCFLVISGWYGLKFKWKHIVTIWSILVGIYIPCYLLTVIYQGNFSIVTLLIKLFAFGQESYYVQCYLMLLFLSPILNSFIKKYANQILPYSLAFWAIEIVFDWILKNRCLSFGHGYELTHFILMYILGQTAFMYKETIQNYITSQKGIAIYLIGAIIVTIGYTLIPAELSFAYSNPMNVIMSFALFFVFERRMYYNKFINNMGKGTLTVYILHITPPVYNILTKWDNYVFLHYSYANWLIITFATIVFVFVCGILYDKIRLFLTSGINKSLIHWIDNKTEKYTLQ